MLDAISAQFYPERIREFMRDRNALLKAISRYGYECEQRGWELDENFILHEIMGILKQVKLKGAEIAYLPIYLEGAMRRHVGQRSEEIQKESKRLLSQVNRTMKTVKVADETVRVATPVETLALMYRDLKRNRRKKNNQPATLQPELI